MIELRASTLLSDFLIDETSLRNDSMSELFFHAQGSPPSHACCGVVAAISAVCAVACYFRCLISFRKIDSWIFVTQSLVA